VLRLAVVVSVRLVTGAKAPHLADVKVVVAVRTIPDDVAAVPTGVYVPPLAREIRVVLVRERPWIEVITERDDEFDRSARLRARLNLAIDQACNLLLAAIGCPDVLVGV